MSNNRLGEVRPRSRKFATDQAWTGFAVRESAAATHPQDPSATRVCLRSRRGMLAMEAAPSGTRRLGCGPGRLLPREPKNGGSVMNTFRIALPAIMLACGLAGPARAQQFGYACETCPTNWGVLSEDFEACRVGEEQSPIDISEPSPRRLAPVRFDYGEVTLVSVDRTVNIELELEDQAEVRVGVSGSTRCSFTSTA